jgi:low temperature requirement protein LtrA
MKAPKDSLLRARRDGEETLVGFIELFFVELFFDLVFVFAPVEA